MQTHLSSKVTYSCYIMLSDFRLFLPYIVGVNIYGNISIPVISMCSLPYALALAFALALASILRLASVSVALAQGKQYTVAVGSNLMLLVMESPITNV